jgi:nucleoside-diphosphate-sugar epimerase
VAEAAAASDSRPRFIQVSSLAAREPDLSDYARTKLAGEAAVLARADRLDLTIVRPPAVYGPGDRATLMLFRQLAKGVIFVPAVAAARFSLIFVDDLAHLLVRLAAGHGEGPQPIEPDDGRPGGHGWNDLAATAAKAVGRPVRTRAVPEGLLRLPAAAMELVGRLTGRPPLLSRGKLRELYHPDWVCRPASRAALAGWAPVTGFETGCRATLEWYKAEGWLPA